MCCELRRSGAEGSPDGNLASALGGVSCCQDDVVGDPCQERQGSKDYEAHYLVLVADHFPACGIEVRIRDRLECVGEGGARTNRCLTNDIGLDECLGSGGGLGRVLAEKVDAQGRELRRAVRAGGDMLLVLGVDGLTQSQERINIGKGKAWTLRRS